jgi:non-ribosomal peptide synthetase component F
MTLLTAFNVLLRRYTGQDNIVVGSPIANRKHADIEGLIGFFVNTLVMRTDTSGNPIFRDLLNGVKKKLLDAYAHQDLPFEKLVSELRLERDLSRNPLFQVVFALQNFPFSDLDLTGLTIDRIEIEGTSTKFDLEVYLRETEEGLRGELIYNTDLFDAATIKRMAGHYQRSGGHCRCP